MEVTAAIAMTTYFLVWICCVLFCAFSSEFFYINVTPIEYLTLNTLNTLLTHLSEYCTPGRLPSEQT